MVCVVCIVVSAATLHLMSRTLNRVHNEEAFSIFGSAWVFFSIFVHQGISEQPQSWSIRLIMSFWWLASITLMATFTGSLVALFAVNKVALPFHNIEQLAKLVKQGRYTILMDGSSATRTNMIAKSQIPVYKELAHEILVNHRVKYVKGIDKAVDFLVNNAGYVLLGPMTVLNIYAQKDCRFALISSDMLSTYLTIPLSKNSLYSAYFSAKNWSNEVSCRSGFATTRATSLCRDTTATPPLIQIKATSTFIELRERFGFWLEECCVEQQCCS